jgi:two-component system KDP operon response regulator KdpE
MGKKILLIEEDLRLAGDIWAFLRDKGYQVFTATDGQEGLRRIYNLHPDMVILGISSGSDGWETFRRIRELSNLPLLLLMSTDKEQEWVRVLEMGADDCMDRPPRLGELGARVGALLRRARPSILTPSRFVDGDLSIDFLERRVRFRGEEVKLSPTEFRLLACLIREAGRIMTHESLLREIWGPESVDRRNYLKLYIWYLRQKIEDDPRHPHRIITIRGVGYRYIHANPPGGSVGRGQAVTYR